MSGVDSQRAKLAGLRKTLELRLRDRGVRYFDPTTVLEYFEAYTRAASELKQACPDLLGDLPDRSLPEPSGTSDFGGLGYVERHHLEQVTRDIDYIFAVLDHDTTPATVPQGPPPMERAAEPVDASKLTPRQILESMTAAQVWAVASALTTLLVGVAVGSYKLGGIFSLRDNGEQTSVLRPGSPDDVVDSAPLQPGTIIATHYPTGELFAVDPHVGTLRLLSARLGQPSGLAIRGDGEIIVLDSEHNVILAVDPKSGHHRYVGAYLWPSPARALALESDGSALVVLDRAVIRVDLESGQATPVASGDLLKGASGVAQAPSGRILVTTIPDALLSVDPADGSIAIVSKGDHIWHPRAPTIESATKVLLGTAGEAAGVLRVDLESGAQELVVTGPFTTVTGLAIESDGSILVADNGHGAPGDGFLARIDPATRRVSILVSAQTSDWRFLNGRSVAVFPKARAAAK